MQVELRVMKDRLAEGSWVDLEHTLRNFQELTGVRNLSGVSPAMVEEYVSRRLGKVSRATANKDLRTLRAALNRAVVRGQLVESPADRIKQLREPERGIRVLKTEEVGRLLDAAPSLRWKVLIALAVHTGMRLGEMQALRWQDVDLEEGTIWVRNSRDHRTKSGKNRTLPLPAGVAGLLGCLPRNGEHVFHTRDGKAWRNNLQRGFQDIVEKAGIDHCCIHDLRRTFISHLAMEGVNAAVVKKLTGHTSITTTQKYYTRILPDALRQAQSKLPFGELIGVSQDVSDTYHAAEGEGQEEVERLVGSVGATS